jgi:S1-C subfamily serine protease
MAELGPSRRGRRAFSGSRPFSPSTALIAGSLGAAACLTALALFQVSAGSSSPDPTDVAASVGTVETRNIDPGAAAATTGSATTTTLQSVSTVAVPSTISPIVAEAAEDQLVRITIGTDQVATGVLTDGYLITSASAVGNQLSVSYSHRDRWALAYLVGTDPFSDLAVFRSSAESRAGRALEALSTNVGQGVTEWTNEVSDAGFAALGDEILSVSLTENGLVSSSGLVLAIEHNGMTSDGQPLIGLIDTNIRRPDRLGSALIDADGNVIGIVVDTSSSLASAVPIRDAKAIADRLSRQGWANETWIGFVGINQDDGVEVIDITPSGPAETADLRPGDVIRYLDGARIDHMGGVTAGLRRAVPGDTIVVVVERGGELIAVRIQVSTYEPGMADDARLVRNVPLDISEAEFAREAAPINEPTGG